MSSKPATPPGYEHCRLPRTVKPDVPKIDARLRQIGLSEQRFAELCGKGDAGFYRHWRSDGGTCFVRTLARVAEVLGLKDWWELWADYVAPPPPHERIRSDEECLIEQLAVSTLLAPTDSLITGGEPLRNSNFLEQLAAKFPSEYHSLHGCDETFARVFRDLASMGGWLIANADGTFSRRYWTVRECMASIDYRCGAEDGAMFAVAMLQDPNRQGAKANRLIYDRILDEQSTLLRSMRDHHRQVIRQQHEEAAVQIIKEDDEFHRRWPFAPCTRTSFDFALTTIDHSTNRFVETLKRCKERSIELPDTLPSLPSLVQNYYPELEAIFSEFSTVKANDFARMLKVRQLLRHHALSGFNTAIGAETLIKNWPRRS